MGERWRKHIILSMSGTRNSVFALRLASRSLENQVKVKVFTGLVQAVYSDPSHGINQKKSNMTNPKMKLIIVYDNNARPGFKSGWGFSCLIEIGNKKVLFDTGDNAEKLLFNLDKLGIDPEDINILVISHEHWDHTGGMLGVLNVNPKIKVVMPNDFLEPAKIEDGIYTTGSLSNAVVEQSLIVKTKKGNIVISGCAHPGLKKILHAASEFGRIYGVVGGFHGFSEYEVLKDIEFIGACHCTQHTKEIKEQFPNKYREVMAGSVIEI